jgi:TRAP-type C4-dicarboxylate transport system permease small subunit
MMARVLTAAATAAGVMAVIALAALAGVTIVDVTGRYLLNKPVFGSIEISEFLLVLLGFGGLALAELRNSHITVDFFLTALPNRVQAVLTAAAALLGIVFWGFVAWRAVVHAGRIAAAGEVSANWGVPTYPFYLCAAFGSGLLAVVLVGRLVRALREGTGAWTPPPSA